MHELGITQQIVAIAAEHSKGARVTRVVIEVGKLSMVLPDAIRFCFGLCSEGTPIAGAALDIDYASVALGAIADQRIGAGARKIDTYLDAALEVGIFGVDEPLARV